MEETKNEVAGDGSAEVASQRARRRRLPRPKRDGDAERAGVPSQPARKRTQRAFPASSFEEAIEFARGLFVVGSGQPVRRLTLFDHLGKSPDSGASRMLITNSNRYGLTR